MCSTEGCLNEDQVYDDGKCFYCYKWGAPSAPKVKEVKPIPKESKKRAVQNKIDKQQNKEIVAAKIFCEMKLEGCTKFAQGVQHIKGRVGQRLVDVTNKIPACNSCNLRAETHPEEARAAGVAKKRIVKS